MCGINGVFAYHGAANPPDEREFTLTRDHMAARGPDAAGAWWGENRRLVLGNRRLAIIDLDHRADQPMVGDESLHVITYNGEIYNFPALKAELEARGCRFRAHSDTEVLLQLYAIDGQMMVEKLRGMFAFAIWDAKRNGLFLARDPYGIKPLYICDDGWTFRFASQVKALLAGGKVSRDPEPAGVVGFHLYGSVPEPFTLYRDIRALPAGHCQWIDESGPREPVRYANVASVLAEAAHAPLAAADFGAQVRSATLESVRAHCLADVEVGLFLSAGIDSGALLGLMRDAGQSKVRAITLGFADYVGSAEDEVPLAGAVAELYGATHVIRRVTEAEFHADLPDILDAMDQPSIDGVNIWFVAKAAREAGLKVALSGLGGDELLGGYPSFRDIPQWTRWLRAPSAVPGLGAGLRWLGGALGLARHSPKALGMVELGGTYRGAYLLRRGLFLPFELPGRLGADLVREGLRRLKPLTRLQASMTPDPGSPAARVCALESANYMRNQLLRDADWAGMAHSVEVRCPLVDYRLLQALATAVQHMSGKNGKRALAAAPTTPLPAHQVKRAKTGFSVPIDRWLADTAHTPMDRPVTKGLASRAWGLELFEAQWAPAGP
ncbi:MAG TPA: asparagine synthase (glutamine-hydrolyzing) [Caulobacteraceae bacterium]